MRTTTTLTIATLVLLAGFAGAADAPGSQSFTGTYDWADGDIGSLKAEFRPAGKNNWNVKFNFFWNGKDHTWKGTAEGSLADGSELTGTATSGSRNWIFKATIQSGVMRGTHKEIRKGKSDYETGTFEIKR